MKKSWILFLFLWGTTGSAEMYAQTANPTVRNPQPRSKPSTTALPPARPSTTTPVNTPPASPRPGLGKPAYTTPISSKPRPQTQKKPVYKHNPLRYAYNEGNHLLNVGIGLGYSGYYSRAIPIGASYEYGISSDISIGAQLDFASASYYSSYYYYNRYNYRYTATYLGVRGSYHLNRLLDLNSDKLDLYAGLGLGYRNYSNYYDYYSPVRLNGFVGGRFSFSDSFGGFIELGYTGLSYSKLGLSFKF